MNPLDWWCSFVFGVSSELGDVLFNYRDDRAPFSAATQWHLRWPTKIDPSVNLRPALLVHNPLRVVAIFPILEKYPTRQIRSLAALPVVLDTPQPHLGLSFCTSPGRAALLTIQSRGITANCRMALAGLPLREGRRTFFSPQDQEITKNCVANDSECCHTYLLVVVAPTSRLINLPPHL